MAPAVVRVRARAGLEVEVAAGDELVLAVVRWVVSVAVQFAFVRHVVLVAVVIRGTQQGEGQAAIIDAAVVTGLIGPAPPVAPEDRAIAAIGAGGLLLIVIAVKDRFTKSEKEDFKEVDK